MAVFINQQGNQNYRGTAAEYDQVDYAGSLSDYGFTVNADGSITVSHPQFGTDTLSSIEGLWFQGEQRWYSMEDALAQSNPPEPGNLTAQDVDFFAIAGQSNAGNMFWYLDDRTDLPQGNETLDNRITQLTGFNTEIINAAIPASSAYEETTDRGLFWWNIAENRPGQVLLDSVQDIRNSLAAGADLDGLIWAQGESDAYSIFYGGDAEGRTANFIEATLQIFNYFRAEFGQDLPIFIVEMGEFEIPFELAPGQANAFDLIREAQLQIALNDPNIFIGVETDDLPIYTDGIHFTTPGYGELGERLGENIVLELGGGTTPPPNNGELFGTNGDDLLEGTFADNIIDGLGGQDVVTGSGGNDQIILGDQYDQVNYAGRSSDYTFIRNADGTLTVFKPDGSQDTLEGVDGFWFIGEAAWYAADDLAGTGNTGPIIGTNGDDQLQGTEGDDVIDGLGGQDIVLGSGGSDVINLGDGYDQVNYAGRSSDYTFSRNADGTISVLKPDGSADILEGVDGFWFQGEAAWFGADALTAANPGAAIDGTAGDDQLFGTEGSDIIDGQGGRDVVIGSGGDDVILLGDDYDQVNYSGASGDYGFSQNADGTISVFKPDGSTDTLEGVDGFWFQGEAAWYDVASLLDGGLFA